MDNLYTTKVVRLIDQDMIKEYVSSGYELMTRAAQSVLEVILKKFPASSKLIIFCGQGNNAGDGYVLARLALFHQLEVKVYSLVTKDKLSGDALLAYNDWCQIGRITTISSTEDFKKIEINADIIVDAILGTGLNRILDKHWNNVIAIINQIAKKTSVIAIDIPSGLDANTGNIWGNTIKADMSITFIAKKQGMYTAKARDFCGKILFRSLAVPKSLYQRHFSSAKLLNWKKLKKNRLARMPSSHKGSFGKVLIVGGNYSMPGAVTLAAMAAFRSGVGLVKILTHQQHVLAIQANFPEVMVIGIDDTDNNDLIIEQGIHWADSLAIGPGLGSDLWSKRLFKKILLNKEIKNKSLLLDADALNLLAFTEADNAHSINFKSLLAKQQINKMILTPHPGEAARLLQTSILDIEKNRYQSVLQLQEQMNCSVILKGAGSLVATPSGVFVCPYGNSGMSTAGMGDCLTGIISSLLAQGYDVADAAKIGVCLHAKAADLAAKKGQSGLIASDIFPYIRKILA